MSSADLHLDRLPKRGQPQRLPEAVPGELGMVLVDATWGTITPIELAPGVRTVGELEVLDHIRAGGRVIDTRIPEYLGGGMIPTAVWVAHGEIAERQGELDPEGPTVLYCNGPQCAATPDAISSLLDAGVAPERLWFYRGGVHDWVTLGLPLVGG
ncbi:MAG TPA: rhodanese-like domain-containing protein [Capillimicrobium sp.]|jgi:rhodanese-related sulfurtransferase